MRGTYVVRGLVNLGAYGVLGGGGTVAEGGVGVFGDLCFARTRSQSAHGFLSWKEVRMRMSRMGRTSVGSLLGAGAGSLDALGHVVDGVPV